MKWILVYIIVEGTTPVAINAMGPNYTFDSMIDCFAKREQLALKVGGKAGYYPSRKQAICVKIADESI